MCNSQLLSDTKYHKVCISRRSEGVNLLEMDIKNTQMVVR